MRHCALSFLLNARVILVRRLSVGAARWFGKLGSGRESPPGLPAQACV